MGITTNKMLAMIIDLLPGVEVTTKINSSYYFSYKESIFVIEQKEHQPMKPWVVQIHEGIPEESLLRRVITKVLRHEYVFINKDLISIPKTTATILANSAPDLRSGLRIDHYPIKRLNRVLTQEEFYVSVGDVFNAKTHKWKRPLINGAEKIIGFLHEDAVCIRKGSGFLSTFHHYNHVLKTTNDFLAFKNRVVMCSKKIVETICEIERVLGYNEKANGSEFFFIPETWYSNDEIPIFLKRTQDEMYQVIFTVYVRDKKKNDEEKKTIREKYREWNQTRRFEERLRL